MLFSYFTDEVASCPDDPRGKTAFYKGSCYEFIPDKVSYPKAKNMCSLHSGHLVTIRNKDMQVWSFYCIPRPGMNMSAAVVIVVADFKLAAEFRDCFVYT